MDKIAYDICSKEYLTELYESKKYGLPKIQADILQKIGIKVSTGFLCNRLSENGIKLRTSSQARRVVAKSLDWDKSFLTEEQIESVDGFLIGDGYAHVIHDKKISRFSCGVEHKEFSSYMRSFFLSYDPSELKYYPSSSGTSSGTWDFRTRYHPDLYIGGSRWYPPGMKKSVPDDVRITPTSVMMWYLGDGTVIVNNKVNTIILRLSTDCFKREQVEDILIAKLRHMGIDCHRNNENRINVSAKGIPAFFDFIGRSSPVKCYDYKFALPVWRFESKRIKTISQELSVDYNRLLHLVQSGKIPCYRASEKGRPRLLPEHIEIAKELIKTGDLY